MTDMIGSCPIWDYRDNLQASFDLKTRKYYVSDSPRAGGGYIIAQILVDRHIYGAVPMTTQQKVQLTTWLVDQRLNGNQQPEVTEAVINSSKNRRPLPAYERARRLLRYIADHIKPMGSEYGFPDDVNAPQFLGMYGWSESMDQHEVGALLYFLLEKGWLASRIPTTALYYGIYKIPRRVFVTVDGYSQIETSITEVDSAQVFVAMSFHENLVEVYEKGIEPAIKAAGYKPMLINQKEFSSMIEDAIKAEIRRSRFIVADLTEGPNGTRGSVYYETGFAHGLDLTVIFTCAEKDKKKLHFDIAHYNHIFWTDLDDLGKRLSARIRAEFQDGPEIT